MSETLSNLGTKKVEATERQNAPGQLTSILDFSPTDGMVFELETLFALALKLRDSNDNQLPQDTTVTVRYDAPHYDQPKIVSFPLENIQVFRTLSIKEQQEEDYRDRTRIELKGQSLTVRDVDTMEIAIESDTKVDWSNSRLYIDKDAVSVHSEE
jgi:hypothetical protein